MDRRGNNAFNQIDETITESNHGFNDMLSSSLVFQSSILIMHISTDCWSHTVDYCHHLPLFSEFVSDICISYFILF